MAGSVLRGRVSKWTNDGLQYVYAHIELSLKTNGPSSTVIGKAEGQGTNHHGHITALSVAPEYRRLSLAKRLVSLLEDISDSVYQGFFVDLYVRPSNEMATGLYEGMGYSVFRVVKDYYGNLGPDSEGSAAENAYGMSKFCFLLSHNFVLDVVFNKKLTDHIPDMRKPLSRDPQRKSVRANGRDVIVNAASVS
jgi:ribosomal protein S18 acetylase RimI-like enzyme